MRLLVPLKFKRLHKNAVIPQYATPDSACVDLVATEIEYHDEDRVTVKFGFASEFKSGYKIHLKPRSSFCHNNWVMQNSPGTIDSDYRGEWMAKFQAIPISVDIDSVGNSRLLYDEFPYKVGDRVVQAEVEVNIHIGFKEVEELSETIRGKGGFGSTGR